MKVLQKNSTARERAVWLGYLLAGALTALTLFARMAAANHVSGSTLVVFTIPIVLSAYWGGLGPGLLATALSMVSTAYYMLPPLQSIHVTSTSDRLQELALMVSGVLISVICMLLHRDRQRKETVIAEMHTAEESLRLAHRKTLDLQAAIDEHAIVATTNPRGEIQYVNDKFCSISKYTREELLGQDHRLINSGHHSPEFIRGIWRTIAQGNVWHGDIKNKAKDGSFYWVDTTIVPFLNDVGHPVQYIAIRADITERKRAEDALRESEAKFRTMANSIPQLAWIAHADGSVFWYNQRWFEYTGTTVEEMERGGGQSVHHPDVLSEVTQRWAEAIRSSEPFEMEFPLRGADGTFRAFLTRIQPIKDGDGRVIQWFGTNTDIDRLKHAEETVHSLNATLERRVLDRTAEVEAANRELEAFSYSISHDLRAPLRAMNGFAGMALEALGADIPPTVAHYLDRIRNNGLRMGQLIDDLLAFSRLGRQPVNRQAVNMKRLVESVILELNSTSDERPIDVQVGMLSDCFGDPALLTQVWTNLISNAIKYSKGQGRTQIEISSSTVNGENCYFVRDNGVGFDMQYAHKLFGVFQRLHRAEEFEGTGVGLAIVQRVVHRHGGRVWADAKLDHGATFHFTIPHPGKP